MGSVCARRDTSHSADSECDTSQSADSECEWEEVHFETMPVRGHESIGNTPTFSRPFPCAMDLAEISVNIVPSPSNSATPGVDEPSVFWPATPESTPPNSPRVDTNLFGTNTAIGQMTELREAQECDFFGTSVVMRHMTEVREADESERLIIQLDDDAVGRSALLGLITRSLLQMAITPGGSRVVQKALEVVDTAERVVLAEQLRGNVWEACVSPHANHVLQKCIELVPADCVEFMFDELKGNAINAARHRYGCRVLERLIEHCSYPQTAELVAKVLTGASQLCRRIFGNFVIQHILVHGTTEQRKELVALIGADIQRLARHRVASHFVRCALVHCASEDKQCLVNAMCEDAGEFGDLAHHYCGIFVVREMKRADGKGH